jgi:hypothetical protein
MQNIIPWLEKSFNNELMSGTMRTVGDNKISITGNVKTPGYTNLSYWAAANPDYMYGFSGSALPFPNPDVAYDNTPNKGSVKLGIAGSFNLTLTYPNAYYIGLGTLYMPPHVNFKASNNNSESGVISVKIDDGVPFRSLTYPSPPGKRPRSDPLFYSEPFKGARTQDEILRAKAYPEKNVMPDNFWGDSIPN